jgi:two-component system, LuxR family, response regulator FixJ
LNSATFFGMAIFIAIDSAAEPRHRAGMSCVEQSRARQDAIAIEGAQLSSRRDIPTVVEAIKDGAFDFIEKRPDGEATVACVRETIDGWTRQRQQNGNGGQPLPSSFLGCDLLTPRERDVLSQITAAASNKETAATLGISQRTVEVHRVHIMQKLGAKNTAHLVRIVLGKRHRAW